LMKSLWDALPPTRRGGYAETAEALSPRLTAAIEPGDVVMVKGSKGSKAHMLATALAARDTSGGASAVANMCALDPLDPFTITTSPGSMAAVRRGDSASAVSAYPPRRVGGRASQSDFI